MVIFSVLGKAASSDDAQVTLVGELKDYMMVKSKKKAAAQRMLSRRYIHSTGVRKPELVP